MIMLDKPFPFGIARRTWPWFAAGFAVLLWVSDWDDAVVSRFVLAWPESVRNTFGEITVWGESDWILIPSFTLFIILSLAALVLKKCVGRLALAQAAGISGFIFLAVGTPGLLSNIAKRLIGRARPQLIDTLGPLAFHPLANDWRFESFPSGHTTTAFALAWTIGFLAPRYLPFALIGAIAIGFSRIAVGMHYPTDVLAGVAFGTIGAFAVRNFFAERRWVFEKCTNGAIAPRSPCALQRIGRRLRQRPAI
jgi:membrane-associated phospholipid phosphatase